MSTSPYPLSVAALTAGRDTPSSRFRVRQHIAPLAERGIHVREWMPRVDKNAPLPLPRGVKAKYALPWYAVWQGVKIASRAPGVWGARGADLLWLQRELLPGYLTLEPALVSRLARRKRPVVLDADDAIWTARPFGAKTIGYLARNTDLVLAGNAYLADWFQSHGAANVRIVPTAIDTDRFRPCDGPDCEKNANVFTVGWSGLSSNLKYVRLFEEPLARFFHKHADARLRIIADKPPVFPSIRPEQIEFVAWSRDSEAEAVRSLDAGLMPLPDDEWTRGKCSFKMLQYMACAAPVVASPVGMNRDVLAMGEIGYGPVSSEEWFDALETLYNNRSDARKRGVAGLQVVRERFSVPVVADQIAEAFRALV